MAATWPAPFHPPHAAVPAVPLDATLERKPGHRHRWTRGVQVMPHILGGWASLSPPSYSCLVLRTAGNTASGPRACAGPGPSAQGGSTRCLVSGPNCRAGRVPSEGAVAMPTRKTQLEASSNWVHCGFSGLTSENPCTEEQTRSHVITKHNASTHNRAARPCRGAAWDAACLLPGSPGGALLHTTPHHRSCHVVGGSIRQLSRCVKTSHSGCQNFCSQIILRAILTHNCW